jgi:Leu/Phe-tRNA-protein transferase
MIKGFEWVQNIYNKIRFWKAPKWYVDLMAKMQKAAWDAALKFSVDELALIKAKIVEVEAKDIDGDDKFSEVWEFCKSEIKDKTETDIKTMIQNTYAALKDSL